MTTGNIVAYITALIVLVALDMLWLGSTFRTVYLPALGGVMSSDAKVPAAVVFYAIYPVGLVYFAIAPALRTGAWSSALIGGALFGFFVYMTYDLTNLATLKEWSLRVSLIDMAWGTVLNGVAATVSYLVTRLVVR
jgi:uncharacterized membrane protein